MPLPNFKEEWTRPPGSAAQTTATIVVALAAVASFIVQAKDHPKLAYTLVILAVLVLASTFAKRTVYFFQIWRVRARRNKAARDECPELLRLVNRFAQFCSTNDWSNIRPIILSLCGNSQDKCTEICQTDYMREISPLFVNRFERRLPENEEQLISAARELYEIMASYNRHYVLEPFDRMRAKRWPVKPGPIQSLVEKEDPAKPNLGSWIDSLPESQQSDARRRIDDFRERWNKFLDDCRDWLERLNQSFGCGIHVYFERPQKL